MDQISALANFIPSVGLQDVFSNKRALIIYFKGTTDIFGINSREQGLSLLLKAILTEKIRDQRSLFIGKKGEKVKFSRDEGNMLPPSPSPRPLSRFVISLAFVIPYILTSKALLGQKKC